MESGSGAFLHRRARQFDSRIGNELSALLQAAGLTEDRDNLARILSDVPDSTYEIRGASSEDIQLAVVPSESQHGSSRPRDWHQYESSWSSTYVVVQARRKFSDVMWNMVDGVEFRLAGDGARPAANEAWILGRPDNQAGDDRFAYYLRPSYTEEVRGELVLPAFGGTDAQNFARSRALPQIARFTRPSRAVGQLPAPRLVKSARQSEEYAAEVMESFGLTNVRVTPEGADGGVDVTAEEAVAQVKMQAVPTGRPVVQAIFGIAAQRHKTALAFSLSGFTEQAIEWAEQAGVGLFEFSFDGSIEARSQVAENFMLMSGVIGASRAEPLTIADAGEAGVLDDVHTSTQTGLVAQLEALARLHEFGALTDEEFNAAKTRLLF